MKKLNVLSILVIMMTVVSCTKDEDVFGSGELITENRNVETFTKISSSGVFELSITQGDVQSVQISADDNIMSHVRTEVNGGELMLYLDGDEFKNLNLSANVIVRDLDAITNEGAGSVYVSNISSNGTLTVMNAGSADVSIAGIVRLLKLENEGSGNFQGFQLEVEDAKVKNRGAGYIEISCSKNLEATIQGSGNIYYKGTPSLDVSSSGSGSVVKVD